MLQNVCENLLQILEEEKHHQLQMFVILRKKWKKLASSSINQSMKMQKQCVHPRIMLLWQKVCVKRHQHQFTVVLNNWTFRRHHWDEFCIKTLVGRHTKLNWFRSWSQLSIQCVFASLSGPAIDLQKMTKKNHIFRWSSFCFWRVCKQAKLSHLVHGKPACMHCRCLVRILDQRHNWVIFLRKWTKKGNYSQWQPLSIIIAVVLTARRYVPHSRSCTRCFTMFCYQPQSWCRLAISELRFDAVELLFMGCRQR